MPTGVRSKSNSSMKKGTEPRLGVLRACIRAWLLPEWMKWPKSTLFSFLPSLLLSKTGVTFSLFFRPPIQTDNLVVTREKSRALFLEGSSFRTEWFETIRLWTFSVGDWVVQTRPSGQSLLPTFKSNQLQNYFESASPSSLSAPPFCPYLLLLFSY